MRGRLKQRLFTAALMWAVGTYAAHAAATLTVHAGQIADGGAIPSKYAVCVGTASGEPRPGQDINPEISWSAGPAGTKSYALIMFDTDVPLHRPAGNNPIPATAPRHDFFHWVLADIPPDVTSIAEGAASDGMQPHGKPASKSPVGRPGLNSFTMGFKDIPEMSGDYFGYDGPCPPPNDEMVHHYHFRLFALSVARLDLGPDFTGPQVLAAMQGKILAQGGITGRYSTNPRIQVP